MTQVARGLDPNGLLLLDVVVNGIVPESLADADLQVQVVGQEQEKAVFWTPLSCLTTYRMQGPFSMKERTPQTKSFTHSYTCFQSVFTPTVALLHHPPEPEELGDRPQAPQEGPHVRGSLTA